MGDLNRKEKAIRWLTQELRSLRLAPDINGCDMQPHWQEQIDILEACLEAVRACHIGEATDMVPLPLEQLMGMEKPAPVWAEVENKTIEGWGGYWCLCVRGHILTPSLISMYAEKMEGVKFYSHHPAHIDREAWVSVEDRLPEDNKDGETVLVIVSGKPHENITLHRAIMTAGYFQGEGWVVNEYPEWESPEVTYWMPLPEPPGSCPLEGEEES